MTVAETIRKLKRCDYGPLSMKDVRNLRSVGLWQLADIAETFVLRSERRRARWYRRLWRWAL